MWPTHPAHHGPIPTKARLVAPLWLQGGVARATRALGVGRNRLAAGCCLCSTHHQTPARHSRCAARCAHVARAGGLHGLVLPNDSCSPESLVAPSTTDPAHTIRKGARLCLPLPAEAAGAAAKCFIDVLIILCNFVVQLRTPTGTAWRNTPCQPTIVVPKCLLLLCALGRVQRVRRSKLTAVSGPNSK